jgi:alpha-tubulin suppressor-like RCC1 family protein
MSWWPSATASGACSGAAAWARSTRRRTSSSVTLDGLVSFAGSGRHGIAMRADGTVWTWGENTYGQPTLASHLTPFQVVLPH